VWNRLHEIAIAFAERQFMLRGGGSSETSPSCLYEPVQTGSILRDALGERQPFVQHMARSRDPPGYHPDPELLRVLVAVHRSEPYIRFTTTNHDTLLDDHLGLQTVNWNETDNVKMFFSTPLRHQAVPHELKLNRPSRFLTNRHQMSEGDNLRTGMPSTPLLVRIVANDRCTSFSSASTCFGLVSRRRNRDDED
jgi:hypothetical protein